MCVYNGERFVHESVESILGQSFGDFEFLIVDDACTDGTGPILASFRDKRIRILRNEKNLGLTLSLNRGLAEARGRYMARQDADDISLPDRLRDQHVFMSRNSDVAVSGGMAFLIDESGETSGELNYPVSFEDLYVELFFSNPLIHGSVFCDLNAVRKAGGYDEHFDRTQDYELWVRLVASGGQIRNLPRKVIKYRRHDESLTGASFPRQEELARQVLRNAYESFLGVRTDEVSLGLLREFLLRGCSVISRSQVFTILRFLRVFRRSLSGGLVYNERVRLAAESRLRTVLENLISTRWKREAASLFLAKF